MPLPAASFINQLDPTQPTGTQKKYEGDDWFRLIQFVLQTQFPNLGAQAVLPTALQLNTITLAIRVQSPETPPLFPLIAARANRLMVFDASGNFDTSRSLVQFDADVFNTNIARNQAGQSATNAGQSETNAGQSATAAGQSATLSMQWATNLTAVPGGGGLFGSRYYAQQAGQSATNAGQSETNAGQSATAAAASAAQAGNTLNGTSTTSLVIGAGSKSLTTQANKAWLVGSRLRLASQGTPGATMRGNVTAYNASTGALTILMDGFSGSGTFADWNIVVIGADGTSAASAFVHITGTTANAVADTAYVWENAAQSELVLPAAPGDGIREWATPSNNRTDNVFRRNGKTIMGLSEDLVVDNAFVTVGLQYNATTGDWRLI